MQSTVPLFQRQFFQAFRQTLSTCNSTNLRFCTQAINTSQSINYKHEHEQEDLSTAVDGLQSTTEEDIEDRKSLCGRIEKLDRGDPVGSAFQSWMGDGFPIHRGHIFHTINRLRRRKFNKRALEVMLARCSTKCL